MGKSMATTPSKGIFVTIASEKGGQAKTTTSANLGMMLCLLGFRVLLLGCDPQGGLEFTFGIDQERLGSLRPTLYEVLLACAKETYDVPISSVILQTWYNPETKAFVDPTQHVDPRDRTSPLLLDVLRVKGVKLLQGPDLAPISRASVRADAELQAAAPLTWMDSLSDALAPVMGEYDYAIADTNPSAGILTALSLCNSPFFLCPITPEQLSVNGAMHLFQTVRQTRRRANPSLSLTGILFTRVANYKSYDVMIKQLRENLAQELSTAYPDLAISFFQTMVAQSRDGVDASADRSLAVIHRPNSPHAISYWYLLAELVSKIGGPAHAVMPEVMRGLTAFEEKRRDAAALRKRTKSETAG
jgi:chromosome partitioning protein